MATFGIVRTNWDTSTGKETLKTLVRSTFDSTDRKAEVFWPSLFYSIKTNDQYEREQYLAGLGAMSSTPEGQNYHIDEPKYGGTKDFTQAKFTNGFRITEEMKKFNKINLMTKLTKSLRQTMEEGKDIILSRLWNNMAATTYCAGFDTYALAHDAHTCLDDAATTFDNYLDADLTMAGLESAIKYFHKMYDAQGNIYVETPEKLVVGVDLQFKAYQLLQSQNLPFEQSNTKNIIDKWGLKVFVYPRFTSTTAWAVLGKIDEDYGPRVYTSMEPNVKTKDAPDRTADTLVLSGQMFTYGFTDSRRIFVGNT